MKTLVRAEDLARLPESRHVHQFNDNAVRLTRSLSELVGLTRLGVHLVRLEPGRDSTEFHRHLHDEEFLYILEGRGMAHLGEETISVGKGDFMGFGEKSVPHAMSNPFEADLLYLMAGERNRFDVCEYPHIKRRMYRLDGKKEYVDTEHLYPVQPGASAASGTVSRSY